MRDPFEGQIGSFNRNDPDWRNPNNIHARQLTPDVEEQIREMRKCTFLSCWHESDVESAAMWDLYASDGKGIAISCSWGDLIGAIHPDIPVEGMSVIYKDYDKMPVPENNVRTIYGYKRSSFRHEEEVRLVVQDGTVSSSDAAQPMTLGRSVLGTGYLAGEPIPDPYRPAEGGVMSVPLDLAAIRVDVKVSPDADDWWIDPIIQVTRQCGLDWSVSQSMLYKLA